MILVRGLVCTALLVLMGFTYWTLRSEETPNHPTSQPTRSAVDSSHEDDRTPPEESSRLESRPYDELPTSLVEWFERLASVEAEDERESYRYALRELLANSEVDPSSLLSTLSTEQARSEVIPLWIDVHGPPCAEELQTWLTGQCAQVRSAIYRRLARHGTLGRRLLAEALANEDESLGSDALLYLLRRAPAEVAPLSAAVGERALRLAMAGVLQNPNDARLATVLREALKRPLPFRTREAVIDALATTLREGLRSAPASPEDLFARTADPDLVVRTVALREAGTFMDTYKKATPPEEEIKRVRDAIRIAATQDADPMIRRAAILSRVAFQSNIRDLEAQCRSLLEVAAVDSDPGVRAAVLRRVHRGSARSRMALAPNYLDPYLNSEPDPEVRKEAVRTLPRYLGLGDHESRARAALIQSARYDLDPWVRVEALVALSEMGFETARPEILEAGLHDRSPKVRDAIFAMVRDQIGELDAELFRALQAANTARATDVPAPLEAGNSGSLTLRMVESRGSYSELPEILKPAPEEEVDEAAGYLTHRFEILVPEDGLRLAAELHYPANVRADLLLYVPENPLRGGNVPNTTLAEWKALARCKNAALLSFDYRGRGLSEGHAGNDEGERRDFNAVLKLAQHHSSPIWPTTSQFHPGLTVLATDSAGRIAANERSVEGTPTRTAATAFRGSLRTQSKSLAYLTQKSHSLKFPTR